MGIRQQTYIYYRAPIPALVWSERIVVFVAFIIFNTNAVHEWPEVRDSYSFVFHFLLIIADTYLDDQLDPRETNVIVSPQINGAVSCLISTTAVADTMAMIMMVKETAEDTSNENFGKLVAVFFLWGFVMLRLILQGVMGFSKTDTYVPVKMGFHDAIKNYERATINRDAFDEGDQRIMDSQMQSKY